MTSLRVNESTGPESFSAVGVWWTTDESRRIPGTLSFSSAGAELSVQGDLTLEDWPKTATTILGQSARGERITIPSARLNGRMLQDEQVSIEEWVADSVLVGGWLPEGNNTRFGGLSLVTARMVDWAASTPSVSAPDRTLVAAEGPSMRCRVNGLGQVVLSSNVRVSFTPASAALDVVPNMTLLAAEPMTMSSIWDNFVIPVVEFFTFATGQADGPTSLKLVQVDGGRFAETYEWHSRGQYQSTFVPRRANSRRDLISLGAMNGQLDRPFEAWFEIEQQFRSALTRFFSVMLSPSGSVEEDFERTVRALEVWHRTDSDATKMAADEFENLLDTLCGAAPNHAEFVRERLQYQNSMSLIDRLRALHDEAGTSVQSSTATITRIFRRTTDTRNGLTHRAETGEHFSVDALIVVTMVWRAVMHSILLRRLGFSDAEISRMFERSVDGLYLGNHQGL